MTIAFKNSSKVTSILCNNVKFVPRITFKDFLKLTYESCVLASLGHERTLSAWETGQSPVLPPSVFSSIRNMPEPRRSRRGEGGAVARSEEEGKEEPAKEKEVEKKPKSAKGGKRKKGGGGGKEEDIPAGEALEREAGLEKRLAEHLQVL